MSRNLKSESVRTRIVDAARELFLQQGYADTTIRQISAHTGISTGSIYHFFDGKDAIFKVLVEEVLQGSASAAEALLKKEDGPSVALALELSMLIKLITTDVRVAELFAAAHRAWSIRSYIIEAGTARNQALFAKQLPHWDHARYYAATLSIAGVIAALVDERIHAGKLSARQASETLVRAALAAFEVEAGVVERAVGVVAKRVRVG